MSYRKILKRFLTINNDNFKFYIIVSITVMLINFFTNGLLATIGITDKAMFIFIIISSILKAYYQINTKKQTNIDHQLTSATYQPKPSSYKQKLANLIPLTFFGFFIFYLSFLIIQNNVQLKNLHLNLLPAPYAIFLITIIGLGVVNVLWFWKYQNKLKSSGPKKANDSQKENDFLTIGLLTLLMGISLFIIMHNSNFIVIIATMLSALLFAILSILILQESN